MHLHDRLSVRAQANGVSLNRQLTRGYPTPSVSIDVPGETARAVVLRPAQIWLIGPDLFEDETAAVSRLFSEEARPLISGGLRLAGIFWRRPPRCFGVEEVELAGRVAPQLCEVGALPGKEELV